MSCIAGAAERAHALSSICIALYKKAAIMMLNLIIAIYKLPIGYE